MNTITIVDELNNEFDCDQVGYMEGFEYPTSRISIEDLAGPRSSVYIASKAGRRQLSWQGVLQEDFMASRRELQTVLRQGSQKTLKFTTCDGLNLQVQAAIEKLVMPYKLGRSKYLIEAVAADWRFYSQTLHEFETTQTVITGGLGIPAAIPFDMGGGSGSGTNDVLNAGSDVSAPTFIISGPGSIFTIGNQTTGEEFVITHTITSEDTITIDVLNRTITLDDGTNIYSSLTSGDFWDLVPGDNTIRFLATGLDEDTLLTIQWRDAYLGI